MVKEGRLVLVFVDVGGSKDEMGWRSRRRRLLRIYVDEVLLSDPIFERASIHLQELIDGDNGGAEGC